MKKGMPMDLYMIMGIKELESGLEIKKAYHKTTLRHHLDKVLYLLTLPDLINGALVLHLQMEHEIAACTALGLADGTCSTMDNQHQGIRGQSRIEGQDYKSRGASRSLESSSGYYK
nr:DnaJ homolog subfamily C member 7-like [Tanacetum cinerariifolium]